MNTHSHAPTHHLGNGWGGSNDRSSNNCRGRFTPCPLQHCVKHIHTPTSTRNHTNKHARTHASPGQGTQILNQKRAQLQPAHNLKQQRGQQPVWTAALCKHMKTPAHTLTGSHDHVPLIPNAHTHSHKLTQHLGNGWGALRTTGWSTTGGASSLI